MRVLQLAPPWFSVPPDRYGGTELVVSGLADELVAAGHDVTLLASGGSTTRARLRSVYAQPPSARMGDGLVELPHVVAGYRDHDRFDVIHDHTVIGAALGALLEGPPVVHTVHGAWTSELRRIYRSIADRVHLVAISHDHAAHAPSGVPVAGVVHNGIDVARYRFRAEPEGYLAWVGRAGADKGADLAVEVARMLDRPLRVAVKLDRPVERSWWDQVVAPRLGDIDIEVIPNATHDEKVALLGGAQALLFPIRWDEPFGLAMIEANACGTPVVAFARGAAPEVVDDGLTGLLVAPSDVDGLCDAAEQATKLDRRVCREHVEHHFTAARMAADYVRIYDGLLAGRPRPAGSPSPAAL